MEQLKELGPYFRLFFDRVKEIVSLRRNSYYVFAFSFCMSSINQQFKMMRSF